MPKKLLKFFLALLLGAPALGGRLAQAHDSPEHVVELLTAQLERRPNSTELLLRRATEYRALGKLREAANDLQLTLEKDPGLTAARAELSRVLLAQGKSDAALAAIAPALKNDQNQSPSLWMICAEIHGERHEDEQALA